MLNFVYAQNTGILGEGINEYEIYKKELRIALLRATGIISNPKCASRSIPAGPPLLTPELQCIGTQKVRFALCFTEDKTELFRYQEEFLGTHTAFVSDYNIKEKTFIKLPENKIFYGITDEKEAILYNTKKDGAEFIKINELT